MTVAKICLIGIASQNITISNYYVMGVFQSSSTVALGIMTCKFANITINNLIFAPEVYIIGNQSSYIFSFVNQSQIYVYQVSVVQNIQQQQSQYLQQLTQIQSSDSVFFQYGGLCAQATNTMLTFINILYDIQNSITTQFIHDSGVIIGQTFSNFSQIYLQSVCAQYKVQSSATTRQYGVIGSVEGNITIQQFSINLNVQVSLLYRFGIVGYIFQNIEKNYSTLENIIITSYSTQNPSTLRSSYDVAPLIGRNDQNIVLNFVQVINGSILGCWQISGLIGYVESGLYRQINSCLVYNTTIVGQQNCGGLIGYTYKIQNVSIQNCNVSNSTIGSTANIYGGGLIGNALQSNVIIVNIKIQSVSILGQSSYTLLLGINNGSSFLLTNSSSEGNNFINNKLIQNCIILSNPSSQNGC
ncbi:Conserved_hypothetical protein [Hexamita inflata]|uniref:Uncharacterized protein n=1 Tax=Hexamita inflata TaxID=28002 RepID=A0AA86NZC9_9EUKA|nr:Conserved hypothetical protein [Hexamita inflata]CAI9928039.1 Conserved hypothetical protein [Hexamita inflata]